MLSSLVAPRLLLLALFALLVRHVSSQPSPTAPLECSAAYCNFVGDCDARQNCVCNEGYSGVTCSEKPRALALGVSSEGAVVERNRTYFLVESGVWQVGDKIRLTLSQGEATLIAAIAFVPRELMFQFSPSMMTLGAVRELDLITDEPVINTVDRTLYITVLGQQGTTVFNLELVGEREAVIIPGVGVGGSIAILVVIGLLVLGGVLGFLVWHCTVGREKIEIWKAVRVAKKQESQIPDYVPSSGPADMMAMMPPDAGSSGANVMSTAAARQQLIAQQQQSMHGMFDTATTGYGDTTFGSPRDATSFMGRAPSMYDGGGGGRAGTIGGGGDINPVW